MMKRFKIEILCNKLVSNHKITFILIFVDVNFLVFFMW